jgi:hypothetical protein
VRESGEGANERQGRLQEGALGFYLQKRARSTVGFVRNDWLSRAVSGDGVVH